MHRFMAKAWQENGEEDACSLLSKHGVSGRLWCALACSTGCVSVHACCVLLSLKVNRCCEFKYMKTHACVCVFVTALFSRLGLGATACSSSSGLSFSFVSSCASLICESLHNMTLDFNLYLFILFSFGLFPPLLFRYAVQQSQSLWPALSWPSTGLHFVDVLLCVKRRCASPPLDVSLVSYFIP